MSKLSDFLNPVVAQEEKDIVISKRFIKRDDTGNPILDNNGNSVPRPFRVRAISQIENDALVKAATTSFRDRTGGKTVEFDRVKYIRALVVAGTVDPDFREKELCDHFGVLDPEMVPGKMLYAGEYQKLADAIAELSGIGDDAEEEAKN